MNLMNKETINLPRLINLVAEKASVNPATARRFLHDLFAYIEEQLAQGESVKIKGVGEFVRGEDASNPVLFKADEDLAALANEPFSAFSAVELNDEAVDEIKALDEKPEPVQEAVKAEVEEVIETPSPVVEAPQAVEIPVPEETVEEAEPEKAVEEKIEEKVEVVTAPEVAEAEEVTVSESEVLPENEPVVVEEETVSQESLKEVVIETVVQPEPEAKAEEEPEAVTEEPEEELPKHEHHKEHSEGHERHHSSFRKRKYFEDYERDRDIRRNNTMWLVLGVLIGLIIGLVGGYFAGKTMAAYQLPEEDDYALIDELEPDTVTLSVSEITAPVKTDTVKPAANAAAAPATSSAAVEHTAAATAKKAEPVYDTITSKRYLSILAKDHYGEKKYWIFIYNANPQLGNPNQISPGTKVLIPARESFEEATKAQTDAKAQRLLNQLAKKYKF